MKTWYVLTQDAEIPYISFSPNPRQRVKVRPVLFKQGESIHGELKHANDKPATVLAAKDGKMFVFPISVLKELTTKEIISSADGKEPIKTPLKKIVEPATTARVKYADAVVVGGILGFLATYWAQKKFPQYVGPDPKNRIWGSMVLAGIGVYLVYRVTNNNTKIKTLQ